VGPRRSNEGIQPVDLCSLPIPVEKALVPKRIPVKRTGLVDLNGRGGRLVHFPFSRTPRPVGSIYFEKFAAMRRDITEQVSVSVVLDSVGFALLFAGGSFARLFVAAVGVIALSRPVHRHPTDKWSRIR